MSAKSKDARIVSDAEFEEWMRPRLMLFLSADVENSTRLKQTVRRDRAWLPPIITFIQTFPTVFQAEREGLAEFLTKPKPPSTAPWKVLGDEVVFAIDIQTEAQVGHELNAYRNALKRWNSSAEPENTGHISVSVKGTAWLAGFPVANTLIPVPSSDGTLAKDYLGPSMDAGFRLTKWATSQRMAISPELVWWLLEYPSNTDMDDIPMRFHGCADLKGLAEETGYPQIWIEVKSSVFRDLEDKLLGRIAPTEKDGLKALCRAFLEEFGTPRHVPFLEPEKNLAELRERRPEFHARLLDARDQMRSLLKLEGDPEGTVKDSSAQQAAGELLGEIREGARANPVRGCPL